MNEVRLIDANALKEKFPELWDYEADYSIFKQIETLIDNTPFKQIETLIDNTPTFEQKEFEQVLQPIKVNIPEDIKDKLIEELSKPRKVILDESKTVTDCIIAYGDGFESARRLYERPHGEWIFNNKWQDYECNKCHDWTRKRQGELPNFCGNCGADMRKGEEE